jgi:hypothetical protein
MLLIIKYKKNKYNLAIFSFLCYSLAPMSKKSTVLSFIFLAALPLAQQAAGWEWQFSLGPWTLEPWASPVEREAEKMVGDEARQLLAPLLSEFTVFAFEPQIDLHSRGWFATVGCWHRLATDKFALGLSASYLDFSLPFTLLHEQDIFLQNIHIAYINISGQGQIDLRTVMFTAQGRWRMLHSGRTDLYAGLGLTLLKFSGKLHLPLTARIETFLGTIELHDSEDMTLAELRTENDDIPAWILSPALAVSLHYRLGSKSRLFMEINLSQGTFLAIGLALGN